MSELPDLYNFVATILFINGVLLFFNLIPVYPLDGGQIVRGLLWLKIGPIRSLKAASITGFAGAILFALWAFTSQDIWLGIIAFFIFAGARAGWHSAQNPALESEKAARRDAAISPPPDLPPVEPAPVAAATKTSRLSTGQQAFLVFAIGFIAVALLLLAVFNTTR